MATPPFSEYRLFDQEKDSDPFFATGSIHSIGEETKSFSSALKNKEQIRLTFTVKNSVKMLAQSASIYYFNFGSSQWNMPIGSLSDHTDPFGKVSLFTLTTPSNVFPPGGGLGSLSIEDHIGFDCQGNSLASGSLEKLRNSPLSKISSFTNYDKNSLQGYFIQSRQTEYLTDDYQKSVQRNSNYNATENQLFKVPIDQPFLLEKLVVEIPMCFGPGWFLDKTVSTIAYSDLGSYKYNDLSSFQTGSHFDEGGPGITVALFSQKKYGKSTVRDLIATCLISPASDTILTSSNITPTLSNDQRLCYVTVNSLSVITGASSVEKVYSGSNGYYTGSILTRITPSISNGVKLFSILGTFTGTPTTAKESFKAFLSKETIQLSPLGSAVVSVDAFGRAMTGFAQSGGSVFGGEYVTSQGKLNKDGSIKNPYYTTSSIDIDDLSNKFNTKYTTHYTTAIGAGLTPNASAICTISLAEKKDSPYLINPGEKLLLAIAKHRPAYLEFSSNVNTIDVPTGRGTLISSSYFNPVSQGHDVTLNSGPINIVLYGSYVRAGQEYKP